MDNLHLEFASLSISQPPPCPRISFDVMCIVAGYLTRKKDLLSLSRVSKDANRAAAPYLFKEVAIEYKNNCHRFTVKWLASELKRKVPYSKTAFIKTLYFSNEYVFRHHSRMDDFVNFHHMITDVKDMISSLPNLNKLQLCISSQLQTLWVNISKSSSIKELKLSFWDMIPLKVQDIYSSPTDGFNSESITRLEIHGIKRYEQAFSNPVLEHRAGLTADINIFDVIRGCPNITHLDLRLCLSVKRGKHHNFIDWRSRPIAKGDPSSPKLLERLESLHLQNICLEPMDFNRLSPLTLKELHLPLGRYNGQFHQVGHKVDPLVFPINITSICLDSFPPVTNGDEEWHNETMDRIRSLKLEEFIIMSCKEDSCLPGTSDPSLISAQGSMDLRQGKPCSFGFLYDIGATLKIVLLSGNWRYLPHEIDELVTACVNAEELGIAIVWATFNNNVKHFPHCIRSLKKLKAVHILNDPFGITEEPEQLRAFRLPRGQRICIGAPLRIEMGIIQHGAELENLVYLGYARRGWSRFTQECNETGELKRTMLEVHRDQVSGIKILKWIKLSECTTEL